jgi:hypothetical protein
MLRKESWWDRKMIVSSRQKAVGRRTIVVPNEEGIE